MEGNLFWFVPNCDRSIATYVQKKFRVRGPSALSSSPRSSGSSRYHEDNKKGLKSSPTISLPVQNTVLSPKIAILGLLHLHYLYKCQNSIYNSFRCKRLCLRCSVVITCNLTCFCVRYRYVRVQEFFLSLRKLQTTPLFGVVTVFSTGCDIARDLHSTTPWELLGNWCGIMKRTGALKTVGGAGTDAGDSSRALIGEQKSHIV